MLLTHTNRSDRLCVLTMDRLLAQDVKERLSSDARLHRLEVLMPGRRGQPILVEDILGMAPLTASCRLIVLDTRRRVLPRVQEAYNRVSGYNRQDFNRRCYSVVITDGPLGFPSAEVGPGAFRGILAQARLDYCAAAVFFDPLIHSSRPQAMDGGSRCGEQPLPDGDLLPSSIKDVSAARCYLRGQGLLQQGQVREHWLRVVQSRFPAWAPSAEPAMSAGGAAIPGESLPLRTYPFSFEDFVCDCLNKSHSTIRPFTGR